VQRIASKSGDTHPIGVGLMTKVHQEEARFGG